MLLCIDIGNAQTMLGLFEGDRVVQDWRLGTDERRTADEWAVLFGGLLRNDIQRIDGIALCSTVPMVLHEMRETLARHFGGVPSLVVEPGVRTGVPVLMDNPREVGTDRILNALAAKHLYPGPRIIVDLGIATTFDVVSAKGEYVGGAIAPGIELSLEALGRRGAQLRRVELRAPRSLVAKNTVEALQSGAVYGLAAQVDGMVERIIAELGWSEDEVTVVVTGGPATLAAAECRVRMEHEPWLTLIGLRLAYEHNVR